MKINILSCKYLVLTSSIFFHTEKNMAQDTSNHSSMTVPQVIGFATVRLTNRKPEGLLGNFVTDAVKNEAEIYLRKRIDLVFISPNAIKGAIGKGDISEQTISNLLPFDDSLSCMEVPGKILQLVLDRIAKDGGGPVAGIQLTIHNMRASHILLDGDTLTPEKKYTIVAIERNAQGHENFPFLKNIPYINLPNTLTTTVIRYIKKTTSEGKAVNAYFGHRISYH
ncbi:MAG: 5'-nucleotidase [Chitinophagaceae bacterium]